MSINRRRHSRRLSLLCCLALLGACAEQELAPIEQKSTSRSASATRPQAPRSSQTDAPAGAYRVVAGDTLYGIAWRFNLDARDIGRWNNLDDFNRIFVGQTLKLRGPERQAPAIDTLPKVVVGTLPGTRTLAPGAPKPLPQATALAALPADVPQATAGASTPLGPTAVPQAGASALTPTPAAPVAATSTLLAAAQPDATAPENAAPTRSNGGIAWRWPASGKRRGTVAATGAQGVDILGTRGQPVYAAADGQVVYSGNGLRGYGQLIIIKHSDVFLSAYAHNDKLIAAEGTTIKAGQQIAVMGDSEADEVMLHFEIRKGGKAVEPMQFLPAR